MPLAFFWLRVFYIAGILKIEKTFGGDAEISFTRKGENNVFLCWTAFYTAALFFRLYGVSSRNRKAAVWARPVVCFGSASWTGHCCYPYTSNSLRICSIIFESLSSLSMTTPSCSSLSFRKILVSIESIALYALSINCAG